MATHHNKESLAEAVKDHNIKLWEDQGKKKRKFPSTSMMYIGHLLTAEGVQANPPEVEATTNLTKLTDVPGIR